MRLFTLLAGYVAGLAVAMKYRKDHGTSKLDTETTNTSKLNSFIDEVVDIHKTAFSEVKGFVKNNFDEVDNFDDLQSKVSGMITHFTDNLDAHIEKAKKAGTTKKDELLKIASDFYASHEASLEIAKSKAASFTGIPEEKINAWLSNAKNELTAAYTRVQSKFANTLDSETPENSPTGKSSEKKAPTQKSE